MKVKFKRKAALFLAVVIMFTTAFVLPDFSYRTFAEESIVTEEDIDENPETNNYDVLISEENTEEDMETPEENTEEIIEGLESIQEETPTEEVTEENLINEGITDIEETALDTTAEEVKEEEIDSKNLYIKMSEGGSIRFNNSTYSVDNNILYKDLVEYARPNELGYFKINEKLTSVRVIALAELNGTISNFKISTYDGSNFILSYQTNSGESDFIKQSINITEDTYLEINYLQGVDISEKDDSSLRGATTYFAKSLPSLLEKSFFSNYPSKQAESSDPQPTVEDGATTSGTFSVISPTYNTTNVVTFRIRLNGGLLDGLVLNTTCSKSGANNIYTGCPVDGDSYVATASVSNGNITWEINTGNESFPARWIASEGRWGHGYQTSKGFYSYGNPGGIIAFLSIHKKPTGSEDGNPVGYSSTAGITYDLVDSTANHVPFLQFVMGDNGYPASITAYTTRFYSDTDKYIDYLGTMDIDGVLYAKFSLTNIEWFEGIFQFVETATNENYVLERDINGNPVYHNCQTILNGMTEIANLYDSETLSSSFGAVQVVKLDDDNNFVSGAEYTLYKDGNPYRDESGLSSKVTNSDGLITFYGLPNGTYKIKETAIPSTGNYDLDTTEYEFTIDTSNTVKGYSYVYDNTYYNRVCGDRDIIAESWGSGKYGLFSHYYTYGCNEGRRASATFNQTSYRSNYDDLSSMELIDCARHYQNNGASENRKTLTSAEYQALSNKSVNGNATGLIIIKSLDTITTPLVVKKVTSSSCTELVANNPNYSLEGAKFKIYKNGNCTQPLTSNAYDFITDTNGDTTPFNLAPYLASGQSSITVYIKEVEASKGYNINPTPARVVVTKGTHTSSNPATVTIEETADADPVRIIVGDNGKKGATLGRSVEGAIFEVKFYACENSTDISNTTYRRHWYLKTDANGFAYLGDNWLYSSFNGSQSDDFYLSPADGLPALPFGYITVQEVQAPEGYLINNDINTYKTTGTNTVRTDNTPIEDVTIEDDEKKQPFSLYKLADDGSGELKPLSNAGFMAWRLDEIETDANGDYIFDETKAYPYLKNNQKEMFTDINGFAESDPICYGSYIVKETTVPEGYVETAPFIVTITEDSTVSQPVRYISDKIVEYYVRVTKYDDLTGNPILNNRSSYKIKNKATDEFVSFRTYDGSTFAMKSEFTVNDDGVLILPEPLKYGEYTLYETKSPDGYIISNPQGIDFTIDNRTAHEEYRIPNDTQVYGIMDVAVRDNPIYGSINIVKTGNGRFYNETAGEFEIENLPLEGIDFGIYAKEDIISTDGWNVVLYQADELVDTITTDAEGEASIDGLPLGKYIIKELNPPEDYIPMEDKEVELKLSNAKTVNGITFVEEDIDVINKPYFPKVKTTALDDKTEEHTGVVGETVTVVDKVDCSDLVIGRSYTVKGKLYDTATGEAFLDNDGEEITAEKTFTADATTKTVDLTFTYSRKDIEGETIVVFETLYYNDKVVATHTDITDTEQQVHYPSVKTTAFDKATNTHTGVVDEKVTVIDKVACTNLVIGKEYTVKGKLYNTETGGAILENGKEVTTEKTFTAEEENPVIDLEFTLNSKTLQGETIVVFEDLYVKNIKVATHSDLTDKGQQVSYPKVGTKAVDKDTESKSGVTGEVATIVDTVECTNLVVGETYTVKGKLYNTETGEVFLDNGKEVTAEKTFVADKKNTSIEISFTFNSTSLEGQTTTVFEDLYSNNVKVASHSDIADKEQQVDYPRVKTTAKDKATDTHTGVKSETATIIDTVECTNLIVGKEYTVKGKLYNTETGEVFLDGGKEVTAEKTFTATSKDMTVDLEFTFNSMSLEGETIVVFEDLYHKNIKVDSHARLDDKEQQVHYPKIGTTAKNPVDGGKVAKPNKSVKLNDTVDVKSVGVGDKFILKGVIYDKSTGEKLLINGEEVWSEATLTAPDKNFKTDVIFNFDASTLAGKNIVVYEYMYLVKADGTEVLVASHEDINDEGQTIKFSTEPKTGDRGFIHIFVLAILSLIMMAVLVLSKKYVIKKYK